MFVGGSRKCVKIIAHLGGAVAIGGLATNLLGDVAHRTGRAEVDKAAVLRDVSKRQSSGEGVGLELGSGLAQIE